MKVKSSQLNRFEKAKEEELGRVSALSDTVIAALLKIRRDFPDIDRMHPFHAAIIDVDFGIEQVKKDIL